MERGQHTSKFRNYQLLILLLWITQTETSFLIKSDKGFERLVVAIDERLPSTTKEILTSLTIINGTTTHHCHSILENIKELLQRTSDYLFKSTHGKTFFRQISLLLPSNWATINCTMGTTGEIQIGSEIQSTSFEMSNLADIQITPDHPIYNDKPWTLQYGPCGTPGKRISVPLTFITESSTTDLNLRARLLLREWIKSRYGVFDENGFAHDEKYPAEFSHQDPFNGESVKITPNICQFNRTCPTFNSSRCGDIEKVTQKTSLLSLPLDPEGVELCNEKTHVRTVPTKHNFLCDGRSIWEVMRDHPDFKNLEHHQNAEVYGILNTQSTLHRKSDISHPPGIQFMYTTMKFSRLVFLLDRSGTMNQNNRWTNLRQTLYRVFHYIPSGIELGVISYTNTTTVSLPLSVSSIHNRDHLHGRIPPKPLKESTIPCLSCAIRDALKIMKTEDSVPTTLVLVNGSPGNQIMNELEKITELLQNRPIRVAILTFEEGFNKLVNLPIYSQLYQIPTEESRFMPILEQNDVLNDVFLQIVTEAINTPILKVHQTLKWPNKEWQAQGQFMMEDSLGRNTWVTISTEEVGDVDGLQLISPSGKEFDLPLHAEGLVYIKIPGIAEAGPWKYIINFFRNQAPRAISIDVITEARKLETVTVKFWALVSRAHGNDSEIVRIYAEILQGDLPVLNANVTANVIIPGKLLDPKSFSVRLSDTGNGDPDITWGDGIYSTYFTQIGSTPGFFSISGIVDDNKGQAVVPIHTNITRGHLGQPHCCGSSVPHISTTPTGSFIRKVASQSYQIINGITFGDDPYPPSRITDLRIEKTMDLSSEVKLSWTSPGGDFDKGKASRYEIRCYTTREALTNENFGILGILVHNSLTPAPEEYGIRQSSTVGIPWANEVFYYGIVSIDNALNRAKVSNLVSAFIKEHPTSTLGITDAWDDDALVYNLTSYRSLTHQHTTDYTLFHTGATWFRGLSELELYIIIGGAGIFLILISISILILVCVRKTKHKVNEAGPPAYQNIYGTDNRKSDDGNGKEARIKCCWENDIETLPVTHCQKQNDLKPSSYFTDSSSYIPASALCSPIGREDSNIIYRDMYSSGQLLDPTVPNSHHHPADSSSVNSNHSKPSDPGSTVPSSTGPSYHNHQFQLGRDLKTTNLSCSRTPSDDEDGGFRDHLNSTIPCSKGSYCEYDFEGPSLCNGSTYGGYAQSNLANNKRKTRHISFV